MESQSSHPLLKLHLAVFVAGLTGLFGKLVSLAEIPLVWWRLFLTLIIFIPILYYRNSLKRIPLREVWRMCAVGALLGIHWILFYASIRMSNVSIGVVCYALVGFYTAIIDPIVNRHKFDYRELIFSTLTLAGLLLIFHFDTQFRTGILVGAVSSLFAACFTIGNKRLRNSIERDTPTFLLYEILGGWLCLTVLMPVHFAFTSEDIREALVPCVSDFSWLLLLASVCTVGQYLLQLDALKGISSFTVNLTYNLEPVYSILLAVIFFNESNELTTAFVCGITLIIISVILQNTKATNH